MSLGLVILIVALAILWMALIAWLARWIGEVHTPAVLT